MVNYFYYQNKDFPEIKYSRSFKIMHFFILTPLSAPEQTPILIFAPFKNFKGTLFLIDINLTILIFV